MTNPYSVGDWVRWTTPDQIKQGEVITSSGPSIAVRWLGGGETVFPIVEGYCPPYGGASYSIEIIPRPPRASSIERDQRAGHMSVQRAAALLGSEPKRIRALLRAGNIRGHQVDGKWTEVNAEDVMSRVNT